MKFYVSTNNNNFFLQIILIKYTHFPKPVDIPKPKYIFSRMSVIETVASNVEILKNCFTLLLEYHDVASLQRSMDLAENTHKLLS